MICPTCSTANESEYVFCVNCGTSLVPSAVDHDSVATAYPPAMIDTPHKKKTNTMLIVGLVAVLLFAAAAVVAAAVFIYSRSSPPASTAAMPDHLGLFAVNGDGLSELKATEVADLAAAFERTSSSLVKTARPDFMIYSDGSNISLADLKFVVIDHIKNDGRLTAIDFQIVPTDGNANIKRLRFPDGIAAGRYAFIIVDGPFDAGRQRLWPVEITDGGRRDNNGISREIAVAVSPDKTSSNTNVNAAPQASPSPVPKPTIELPAGATVAFCNSSDVIVRGSPGLDGKKLTMLKKNQKVYILRYSENTDLWNGVESNWAFIQTENGSRGWVFTPFISIK